MKKVTHCRCRTSCDTRRCSCLKENEPCDSECGCSGCRTPLNGVDCEHLTVCAIQNVEAYKALSDGDLAELHELPCGDRKVPLSKLLTEYECPDCGEDYWYSFCWNTVVQDNCSWHCAECRMCRDWREWHCEDCNRCTYGVTLPCENCAREGPMSGW